MTHPPLAYRRDHCRGGRPSARRRATTCPSDDTPAHLFCTFARVYPTGMDELDDLPTRPDTPPDDLAPVEVAVEGAFGGDAGVLTYGLPTRWAGRIEVGQL